MKKIQNFLSFSLSMPKNTNWLSYKHLIWDVEGPLIDKLHIFLQTQVSADALLINPISTNSSS